MKKLLTMIGAAAVAVGAYAVEYTYTGGTVSPADGNVTILCNDGGAITNLTMAADNADPTVLAGDTLDFAAGATIKVAGRAVVSNAFTAAGALSFLGVTNATWNGGSSYIEGSEIVVFKDASIDCIVPLQGYGKRGSASEVVGDEKFLYKAFNVVRDGSAIRFEMQLYHYDKKYYRKGVFVELSQSGSNVVGKRLATGYVIDESNNKLGEQMFEYSNGTATAKSGVTTDNSTGNYKLKTLTILPSALTFAVSGTETLNAVSGSGLVVTFEGAGENAKVKASGANTMTSGGFVVKGDAQNPIEYEVAAKYALPTEIECQGTATLKFSTDGTSGDGASKDTDAIVMRPGSTLQITKAYPFHYASGMVTLDGATMSHETIGNAYLNFLTLTNGATISLRNTGTFRSGYQVERPLWTVTGAGRSTYNGDLTLIANYNGTGTYSHKYLTIDVEDTVAGDGTDFLLAGDILLDFKQFKMASFIKSGAGTMEIDGTLYTTNLPVQVTGGTLLLSQSGATSDVSFSLEGGTLALAAGTTNTAATVAVTESSSMSFGSDAALTLSSLTIADGTTLTLAGNVPSRGLRVSSDPGEETLGRIVFADGRRGTVVWDSNGYVRANGKGLIISIH